MQAIRFKGDSTTRKRFFPNESFSHPAKMHSGLLFEIADRLEIQPGSWVLDPMGGSGTTLLLALKGINVCVVELEDHFCRPMLKAWEKIQTHGPMLGYTMGQAVILRGDARTLPLCSADAVLTSPPWADERDGAGIRAPGHPDGERKGLTHWGYTRPAAIVTSPPFQETVHGDENDFLRKTAGERSEHYNRNHPNATVKRGTKQSKRWPGSDGYTRPAAIVDSNCASPVTTKSMDASLGVNIGNLRANAYWSEISKVYAECWRVLRPGGIMALVLKGFTREGQYVDLPGQTETLLLTAGWEKHDEWRRQLWSLSFWRILQKRRAPEAWDERLGYESVLAFRKSLQPLTRTGP